MCILLSGEYVLCVQLFFLAVNMNQSLCFVSPSGSFYTKLVKWTLTWDKNCHLLGFPSVSIVALIHPRVLPAQVVQGQNTGCVTLTIVLKFFRLEVRRVVPLELPLCVFWAGAGEGEGGTLGQDELLINGGDLQTTQLGAEIEESCRWHNKKEGQIGGQSGSGMRSKVKSTIRAPDPVLSLNDEGYESCGGCVGGNDALSLTDVV